MKGATKMQLNEKLVHKNKSVQKVLNYVKSQAEIDNKLADRILLDTKTADKMWDYIVAQARKLAINNSAMVEDDTVYGWALHYFIEEDKAVETKETKAPVEEDDESCEACETPSVKKPDVEQLSLDI